MQTGKKAYKNGDWGIGDVESYVEGTGVEGTGEEGTGEEGTREEGLLGEDGKGVFF